MRALLAALLLSASTAFAAPPPPDWSQGDCVALASVMLVVMQLKAEGTSLQDVNVLIEPSIGPEATAEDIAYLMSTVAAVYATPTVEFARGLFKECLDHVPPAPQGPSI